MKKRFLIGLCVALLIVFPALSALSELYMDEGNCPTLAVFYVPAASKGSSEALAANYTVRMIMARWNGKQNKYVQRTDSTAGTLQAADDAFKYENLFNKAGSEGNDTIKNFKAVKKVLNRQDCDIWFVVPSKAVRNFISNSSLMEQLRELTQGTSSRIHIVFLSKEECALDENTALGALTRDVAVECTTVLPDFQANKANGWAHNGLYFIASLFGKAPLDLPVSAAENVCRFTPNADGKAFVLIRWDGGAGDYAVKNASGQDVVLDSAFSIRPEKGEISYTGCMATGLEKGAGYSVNLPEGAAASVRIFWYPDLDSIQPSLDPIEIQYGENTVQLSVADNLNQPDSFQVQFDFRKDDGEITNPSTVLNEKQNGWTARLNTSTANTTVTIVPRLYLKTADQNVVFEWTGNSVTKVLESGTVELQPEAPEELTLYYYQDHMGRLNLSWDKFFAYNKSDESLQFNVEPANDSGNNGIRIQPDKSGFTLELNSSEVSEGSCDLVLTGKDKKHTLSVYRKDMAPLLNETITVEVSPTEPFSEESDSEEFSSDGEFSEKVRAGMPVEVKVTIPADTVVAWQEASGQIEKEFPPLEDLILESKLLSDETDETDSGEEAGQENAVTNHLESNSQDGSMYGSVTLPTDANAESGSKTIRASLHTGDGSFTLLLSNEPEFELINEPPYPAKEYPSEKEIRLEGFPWNYQTKDNLLELLFGTDQPFDLFQDPEGSLVKITLSVENTDGLEMPDITTKEDDETGEMPAEWTVELTDEFSSNIAIRVLAPGKHKISLSASDGVSDSDPLTVQVEIYSIILRYASYAAAGLLAFLLILILIRIIIQARKPKFGNIQIRCYAGMDDDQERGREILSKCRPVPLKQYGKKPVTLSTVMVLTRQPALSAESSAIADDIQLLPTRHNELNLIFGKDARRKIGRHDKRQLITPGGHYRMRIGNTYIQLENYRG